MNRDWEILVIGGSSGTGKTYLAKKLSQYYKIPFIQVDDIRLSMLQIADKKNYPDLFVFNDGRSKFILSSDTKFLTQKLENVASIVWGGIKIIIENHLVIKQPLIIEGDGVLPSSLTIMRDKKIKGLFLYDNKDKIAEQVYQRAIAEERNKEFLDANFRNKYTEMSYAFGQKIKKQAEEYHFPTLKASPNDNLFERSVNVISIKV